MPCFQGLLKVVNFAVGIREIRKDLSKYKRKELSKYKTR